MTETALITGCSSGIGRATAEAFLAAGWTVHATAREASDLADLADRGCATRALDVTDPGACEAAVEAAAADGLSCLVNNAGYAQLGAAEEVPPELLRRQLEVNLVGPHRLTRLALPHLRAADGTVVNVSSVQGRLAVPGMGAYSASKHALEGLSDATRVEVEPDGVDVVLVEPGPVDTRFEETTFGSTEDLADTGRYERLYAAHRTRKDLDGPVSDDPEDVAGVIVDAATAEVPATRYPVGVLGRLGTLVSHLPAALTDTAWRLGIRLFG